MVSFIINTLSYFLQSASFNISIIYRLLFSNCYTKRPSANWYNGDFKCLTDMLLGFTRVLDFVRVFEGLNIIKLKLHLS